VTSSRVPHLRGLNESHPLEKQSDGQGPGQARRLVARTPPHRHHAPRGRTSGARLRRKRGRAETILASESACADGAIRSFVEKFPADAHLEVADGVFSGISQLASAAGVAAVIRTPQPGALEKPVSGCLLLENIQDPGNLGSILRTAVAAGTRQVFLSRESVFAWSPKVIRAGMGAHFFLSIFEGVDLAEVALSFSGRIIATAPRASTSLYDMDLKGDVAWLFGTRGPGCRRKPGALPPPRCEFRCRDRPNR